MCIIRNVGKKLLSINKALETLRDSMTLLNVSKKEMQSVLNRFLVMCEPEKATPVFN